MSESGKTRPPESPTMRMHKRQQVWQIFVPFAIITAILLTLALLLVTGSQPQTHLWANISLIWLLAPMLILALLLIVLLGAMVYGMARLLDRLPIFTHRAQGLAEQAAAGVRRAADEVVQPFIWLEQAQAAVRSAFYYLLRKR